MELGRRGSYHGIARQHKIVSHLCQAPVVFNLVSHFHSLYRAGSHFVQGQDLQELSLGIFLLTNKALVCNLLDKLRSVWRKPADNSFFGRHKLQLPQRVAAAKENAQNCLSTRA